MASERSIVFGCGHVPIGWTVGFLRAPFDAVAEATLAWWRKLQRQFEQVEIPAVFPDGVLALSPLQTPPTREILARTSGNEWTANLVNNHLGGDSYSWCGHLSEVIGCEAVLATHIPADQYAYPATAFMMIAPRAAPPLHTLRAVRAGRYSERWEFYAEGEVQPFEEAERYGARRIRERLDREMLLRYLAALGIRVDDPTFWRQGVLLQQRVTYESRTSTLDELRRAYGISSGD
ncbi:MAG TPA: hypothetical protein VMI75_23025 [Polyangiaceae bacterium]|nr:hypothetical protein [Polyangiaceae bacterium]